MNTISRTPLSRDTSRAYAGHYGLQSIRNPQLQSVIGKDGPSSGDQSNPSIHFNAKIGPYSRKDPKRIYRFLRFSHMWCNTLNSMGVTPSSATVAFPLEELNFLFHQWKLEWEERNKPANFPNKRVKKMKFKDINAGDVDDPEIDVEYAKKYITYLGVLNTDISAPVRYGMQKMVSIISQGSTNIPNSFGKVNVFTHWRLFFRIEEICVKSPQAYCYDETVGDLTLQVPSDGRVVRISYLASKLPEIPIFCKECDRSGLDWGRYVNPACKHKDEMLAYELKANPLNEITGRDEIQDMTNEFFKDQFITYLKANPSEVAEFKKDEKAYFDKFVNAFDKKKIPAEFYITKQAHVIHFATCEFNDYQNAGSLLTNGECDVRQYQKNMPLKVWMRATNQ